MHPQLLRLLQIEPKYKQNTELTQPSPTGESIQMFLGMSPSHSDAFRNWTRGWTYKGGLRTELTQRETEDEAPEAERFCYLN